MDASSSSFVSKARTAFHSAAAKAEKVITDIKADFKNDRDNGGESQRNSRKLAEQDRHPADAPGKIQDECYHEFKHSRWKAAQPGKKQDWQHLQDCLKNIKGDTKELGEKEKAENLISDIPVVDEDLNWMDETKMCEVKESERRQARAEDCSNASNLNIPPASVIKQLAMAIEAGKKFKSVQDLMLVKDSSLVKEKAGLSFSAMKQLVLRDKDDKSSSEFAYDEELLSLVHSLFDADIRRGALSQQKNGCGSPTISIACFPRDIHGAPPQSFIVRLSEIVGSFKTLQKMASFWFNVISELKVLWIKGEPVPCVPLDEVPDLSYCLLHQQLQVINCCMARKRRRNAATEALDSLLKEASIKIDDSVISLKEQSSNTILYARIRSGDLVPRLGADHPSENLTMLETGEPIYSPLTQEGPLLTEDLIREAEEFVLRTGSLGAGCSQLLSDMQAFKAANPGCILEDFVRWHSPPDWTETDSGDETEGSLNGGDSSSKRGQLSTRMQKEGNLWRELWETAKPLPAVKQTPLFDEDLAVEGILNALENSSPSELFKQLFVSLLGSGFVLAEGIIPADSNFSKLFNDCKDYVVAVCQGDLGDYLDDLCQVYETVEMILVQPEEVLRITQSEETNSGELKSRFKKISLKFASRNKQQKEDPIDKQKPDENRPHMLAKFFDGKSSLFIKKQQKPSNQPASTSTCMNDNLKLP